MGSRGVICSMTQMQDTQKEEELITMKCEVGMWKCSGTVSRNVC
jgi:hypothetical protein